jgi:two-component system, OmpR family, sensor kinase
MPGVTGTPVCLPCAPTTVTKLVPEAVATIAAAGTVSTGPSVCPVSTVTDRITAGDLTDRVAPENTRSEVGRLGAALNGMLARIEAGVHEREAGQEQMRRFFADASHELRTPLASLRANAELYQQGALTSPAEVDEVMRRITLETRRMGRLVEDMLRLARLGQHPSQCLEPIDVTALVTSCAERVRIADPARTWELWVAEGLRAAGDEELLRRAVDNLLTNVLVHTPQDATGTITASGDAGMITIEVRDDGPGVTPDRLPHIFERFYRAGPRQRPGSGLGLAIAAEIAVAHGGMAAAALTAPHGLTVTLTVPAHREDQDYPERAVAALPGTTARSG